MKFIESVARVFDGTTPEYPGNDFYNERGSLLAAFTYAIGFVLVMAGSIYGLTLLFERVLG